MDSFISREEDYALRIIIYLATEGKMVKTKDICNSLYLSRPIVNKIVNKLKSCNFLSTKTGKDGGITINECIYNASVYDILSCMGFSTNLNQCLHHTVTCQLMPICRVNILFSEIQKDVMKRLKNATIKELLFENKDKKLVNL